MARRVAAAGYPLTVWNRSAGRADGFAEVADSRLTQYGMRMSW